MKKKKRRKRGGRREGIGMGRKEIKYLPGRVAAVKGTKETGRKRNRPNGSWSKQNSPRATKISRKYRGVLVP